MLIVFALGLIVAILAYPFEGRSIFLSRWDVAFTCEPYEDAIVLLMFTLMATAVIVLVSTWSLRDLNKISIEAAVVGPHHPNARITTDRLPREIQPMAAAVNGALDRMAQALKAEIRFVTDAAHELRTPLTLLSLRLQQARTGGSPDWSQIDQDLARLALVISQLLDLARKETAEPVSGHSPVIDLARTVREAAAQFVPFTDKAGRAIELELPEALPVHGRREDLMSILRNLLENALVHGVGTIRISGSVSSDEAAGPRVILRVADEGTELSIEQRNVMFDRFRKADPSSGGSGLGLAIVREVVRAHGGTVAFEPAPETIVRVELPSKSGRVDST